MLQEMYLYYSRHPEQMSREYQKLIAEGENRERVVCDYISGMTDQYAMAKFKEIFIPSAWAVYWTAGESLRRRIKKSIFCQRKREPGQIKKDIVAGRGIYIYVGKWQQWIKERENMRYSDDLIEEIRMKNDIVDVISGYVKLQRKGSSYFGLCPFHNEKSPSFSVSPGKQMY